MNAVLWYDWLLCRRSRSFWGVRRTHPRSCSPSWRCRERSSPIHWEVSPARSCSSSVSHTMLRLDERGTGVHECDGALNLGSGESANRFVEEAYHELAGRWPAWCWRTSCSPVCWPCRWWRSSSACTAGGGTITDPSLLCSPLALERVSVHGVVRIRHRRGHDSFVGA